MTQIWKGAPAAQAIYDGMADDLAALAGRGVQPKLCVLRALSDEGGGVYAANVARQCEKRGIAVEHVEFSPDMAEATLIERLEAVSGDPTVHGILLMRPLPRGMDEARVLRAIAPEKDVDGVTDASLAGVFTGNATGFAPCTAEACLAMLDHYGVQLAGKRAVVIGRSLVVGRPVSMLLLHRNATVTLCHSKSRELAAIAREADIVIAAVGKIGIVDKTFANPSQIIIDVGTNMDIHGKLCGDVDIASVSGEDGAAAVTPVPGGVGGVTTALLLSHVVQAAKNVR